MRTSFPFPLVNKSCFGFVYQWRLMSKDNLDSVFLVCLCVSDGGGSETGQLVIGISADARKQQQRK